MTAAKSSENSDTTQKKRRRLHGSQAWSWVPWTLGGTAAVVGLYLGKLFLDRAGDASQPLTDLEQTFFGLYTLVVGGAISWFLSAFYAGRETRSRFMQLARPALRRVVAARESADGLLTAIARRSDQAGEASEAFDSLRELVEQHARVLDDAMADWREVLPEDVGRAEQSAQLAAIQARELAALGARVQDLESEQSRSAGKPDPHLAALRRDLDKLAAEQKEIGRFGYAGKYGLGLTATGSYLTDLATLGPGGTIRLIDDERRTGAGARISEASDSTSSLRTSTDEKN